MSDPMLAMRVLDVSAACVGLHTRMTARAVTRVYDAALKPLGLESTQFTLLAAIVANEDASVTKLAERLALNRSSLSRNLAVLRRLGLIAVPTAHGRAVRYRVTPEGEQRLAAALPLWRAAQERLAAGLGDADAWDGLRDRLRELRRIART